jgi:hypothetical protein
LVGEVLNAVSFVMDYVEFHFNGPVLRSFTNPVVEVNDSRTIFPEAGAQDALCSLIGAEVAGVEVKDDSFIRLAFTDGRRLTFPLNDASRIGPEAATFQGELIKSPLDVW